MPRGNAEKISLSLFHAEPLGVSGVGGLEKMVAVS